MGKKSIFLATFILLSFNILSFAQTENPYLDFNPEKLKSNKEYTRNFNPGTFNTTTLYNCMIDMINLARAEYSYVPKMKHDIKLDSTAQFQAIYQAKKDEKTELNAAPYKTLNFRLKKYGLSSQGAELVSKAKAYLGNAEYTYYDLCFELLKPILKNMKLAVILLNKEYTYVGFGFETDEYMKSMYTSIVLGNDLTFMPYKPMPTEKDLPFSKSRSISFGDPRACQKCSEDISLEQLSEYVSVRSDEILFSCDDHKNLRKMIGKEGDAIVLDFVQLSQYDCSGTVVDNDRPNRGTITKIITYAKLLELNETADKKSTKLIANLGPIPETIDPGADYDINILVLKDGKNVCRTVIKKNVEVKNADYQEKINFCKDETTIKNAGDWVPMNEEDIITFKIPFASNKTEFRPSDYDTIFQRLRLPAHHVASINIEAHNSLNYKNDPTQTNIQKKRVESLSKQLSAKYNGVKPTITYDYSWEDFKIDIANSENYYYFAFEEEDEIAKRLKANNHKIAKELEEYLSKHRYMLVTLHLTYDVSGGNEQDFSIYKFNKAIETKNLPLAMSIQKYIIKQVESKKYGNEAANKLQIPENKQHQALLINKLYMQYFLATTLSDKIAFDMKKVAALDIMNQSANFNMCLVDVYQTTFASNADIAKLQTAIDKLYTMQSLSKEHINNLNLEMQFKVVNYLTSQPASLENSTFLTNTYTKIKSISNQKLSSWQNAYKLASYFIKNHDYIFALKLMDPFIHDPSISDDFLFSYISIGAHRPETYLNGLFTKAVLMGIEKNPQRTCGLFDKFPICVFDNVAVKNAVCKSCNR
ncbi:hypothetical protein LJC68_07985 [Bacteroidales bacterium OttesenSCG-928-B11]|nr:hypothetical protein [Bacteroidales bacterium OttesenSCG-928-B11]MDL2326433.1 hypothetical protein [Bacteroidales bacterium OttesenSCG-928-A14]